MTSIYRTDINNMRGFPCTPVTIKMIQASRVEGDGVIHYAQGDRAISHVQLVGRIIHIEKDPNWSTQAQQHEGGGAASNPAARRAQVRVFTLHDDTGSITVEQRMPIRPQPATDAAVSDTTGNNGMGDLPEGEGGAWQEDSLTAPLQAGDTIIPQRTPPHGGDTYVTLHGHIKVYQDAMTKGDMVHGIRLSCSKMTITPSLSAVMMHRREVIHSQLRCEAIALQRQQQPNSNRSSSISSSATANAPLSIPQQHHLDKMRAQQLVEAAGRRCLNGSNSNAAAGGNAMPLPAGFSSNGNNHAQQHQHGPPAAAYAHQGQGGGQGGHHPQKRNRDTDGSDAYGSTRNYHQHLPINLNGGQGGGLGGGPGSATTMLIEQCLSGAPEQGIHQDELIASVIAANPSLCLSKAVVRTTLLSLVRTGQVYEHDDPFYLSLNEG